MKARIEFAEEVVGDFDRILAHLAAYQSRHLDGAIESIIAALDVLSLNPMIGRPLEDGCRELVIGSGSLAYLALYRYIDAVELVIVLAVRSQREAGYSRP